MLAPRLGRLYFQLIILCFNSYVTNGSDRPFHGLCLLWTALLITATCHRGTTQRPCCRVCVQQRWCSRGWQMLIWATNDVIMSKLNTNNRPRNMFTPCLHSNDAWNELGKCTSWLQPGVFYFIFLEHPVGGTEPVTQRHLPYGPEIMLIVPARLLLLN